VALGAVDAAEGERVARTLAGSTGAPRAVRETAVRTLGQVLGPSRLRATLAPLLRGAPEPGMRSVAAETLARHGTAESCAEVLDQAALESPADRVRFERATLLCAARR
jgi:hypothetical protein